MPGALASIHLTSVDLRLSGDDAPTPSIVAGFSSETQSKTNWCWAAVGTGLYNYWLSPDAPISQAAFAERFGDTQEDVMCNPINIIDALEDYDNAIPRHEKLTRRQLRNSEALWNRVKASIRSQKPVPLAIRWERNVATGHMLCILGVSALGGRNSVIVYDPAGNDAFHDNVREIAFSRDYLAEYRDLSGNPDAYSGYISVAFIP